MTVISVNSISEAPPGEEHLLIYDYLKPKIGYGAKGRIENSLIAMGKEKS